MNKYLFFILLYILYLSTAGIAQNQAKIDSLKGILPTTSGEKRVKVLRDLCYYSRSINFMAAVSYGEQAVSYATEIGNKDQLGSAYEDLGSIHLRTGRYETALDFYKKALAIFVETKNKEAEASTMHNTGVVYLYKANYPMSLDCLFKALKIKNSLGKAKAAITLSSIGEVYRAKKDNNKALDYYFQALKEARKTQNKSDISVVLNNIEIIYRQKGDFEKALEYRMQAIAIHKETGDDFGLAISYNNLGELYDEQGDLEKAMHYFRKSLEIKERMDNQQGISHTSERMARVYTKLNDFKNADRLAQKSLTIAVEIGNTNRAANIYKTLSSIYQHFGKYEQALLYYQDFTSLKDSVFDKNKEVIISDIETKYQTAKKEAENALLKLETEKQMATIAQKNKLVTFFIVGSLILLVLAGLLYHAYLQKNKNNKLLAAQKKELTQLNATKNRFFGIIAHDLRGPLTALQGISGLLNYNIKKGNIENLHKIALQIEDSAQKVNTLLDNLLKWALSQEGAMPFQPQRLALKPIVEESVQYFKDMAAAKDIHIEADIPQEVHVHADKETLSTIFRNLINNSIKFTPNGGSVSLLAIGNHEGVQIDVKDNGTGIEEERIKKLFALNDAKSTSGTNAEKGTGLGLVLVNDFVHMNHGTIEIKSKPNHGSVFSITLPTNYAKAS
ncbi:tetratricopeptide repeat protein [Flammeovirgaceae bacterium SG7u.111]|nr:tetratricopeptide repeat protein [Flammeovirgaceae bacterium SG7u.132]WPO36792.1 tetratricopeptide repeat protein [Flammeovirgaceae bacterium SG7u.111]